MVSVDAKVLLYPIVAECESWDGDGSHKEGTISIVIINIKVNLIKLYISKYMYML